MGRNCMLQSKMEEIPHTELISLIPAIYPSYFILILIKLGTLKQ
jgi:hypothetical protein